MYDYPPKRNGEGAITLNLESITATEGFSPSNLDIVPISLNDTSTIDLGKLNQEKDQRVQQAISKFSNL